MGIGAVAEPLVVVTLLVCGAWVNRNVAYAFTIGRGRRRASRDIEDVEDPPFSPASFVSGDSLLSTSQPGSPTLPVLKTPCKWRERELKFGSFKTTIHSPDSRQFKDRWWSRVMRKFPFLQEVFYWILIYWVRDAQAKEVCSSALTSSPYSILRPRVACRQPDPGADVYCLGVSTRTRIYCRHTGRIHGRCRATPCPAGHSS